MSVLRRVAWFLWSLWKSPQWTHGQFAVAAVIVLALFCAPLGFMAYDNRASVVQAENAQRAVHK